MFLASLKTIFDIDNVGKRWGVRILYLFTVILNAAIYFNPFADTDFTRLNSWINSFMNTTDTEIIDELMRTIPISYGNWIYIATLIIGDFILLTSAYIYAGVFVREFRKEKVRAANDPEVIDYAVSKLPDPPIKASKLCGRIIVLLLFSILISAPIVMISSYLLFFALIGVPFVFTVPVAYLSGDKGLFSSLPYAVRLSRKYYLINMRGIALILLAAVLVDFTVPLLAKVSLTAYYILDSAITTWLCLAFARLAATAYCTMKDFPIKDIRRPFAI